MDGRRLEQILGQWEKTGGITPAEIREIEQAIAERDPVAMRARRLLPLLMRDARETHSSRMTASIMQAVESEGNGDKASGDGDAPLVRGASGRPRSGHSGRSGRKLRLTAIAASLVFAILGVSLLSYTLGYRQGSGAAETTIADVSEEGETVTVHFRVVAPEAAHVSLVGDFNDWDPEATPLRLRDDGETWSATLDLRGDRAYTYNFILDDETIIPDPAAERTIPDSFGGEKSVISL